MIFLELKLIDSEVKPIFSYKIFHNITFLILN